MKDINDTFACFLLTGLIETFKNTDCEEELKKIGYLMGRTIVEKLNFRREIDLGTLLYKITYTLLEEYYPSPRKLEVSKESDNVYFIIEYSPLYSRYISNKNNFCGDSIVCGIISYGLKASGFDAEVNGYVDSCKRYPDKIVYEINVIKK